MDNEFIINYISLRMIVYTILASMASTSSVIN